MPPTKTPNYDKEVLEPLHAAQAKKAEEERIAQENARKAAEEAEAARVKAEAAKQARTSQTGSGGVWERLRFCEAGGDYTKNTGNGFYGAYQFDISTWNNYGGYHVPSDAPAAVQDAKAQDTQARRGWSPWPGCSAKLGLSGGGI